MIIDNALGSQEFDNLYNHIMSSDFEWHFNPNIIKENPYDCQFVHGVHTAYHMTSPHNYRHIYPINNILEPQSIIRIKANLTTRTAEQKVYGMHTDVVVPGSLTAVYYVNDNNGWTEFEDGTKVESVSNRLVIFPSNLRHSGASCTDQQRRVVINFNYIPSRGNKKWYSLTTKEDRDYLDHWEKNMKIPYDRNGVPIK